MLRTIARQFIPPYRVKKPASKDVAILVLLSPRQTFTADEQLSLRHLVHYLGKYDKYLIAPRTSPVRLEGFQFKGFSEKFFGSATAINHLLYYPGFFRAFEDYRYIMIYHLDSLVFSDQMAYWCNSGLDYIGAPWIRCDDLPWVKQPRVGNTGFGLMKVESALKVLYARYRRHPSTYWLDMFTRNSRRVEPVVRWLKKLQRWFPRARLINRPIEEWEKMRVPSTNRRNCDLFWSDRAVEYWPEYKVASLEQGLAFAFEAAPRTCFEMNGGIIPFGCHAWARYDRKFWEPLLLNGSTSPAARHPVNHAAVATA